MKKFILLFASLFFAIVLLVSFSSKKMAASAMTKPASSIIDCPPLDVAAPNLLSADAFKARYGADVVRVRKNVHSLTSVEINAIKVGIIKMKALPYTNPTSWLYQAAIHGTTQTDNLPSWNSCHKVGEAFFFLAWHRMYCYFFERILRAKSGRANLTLPYWNYQTNAVLPAAYRDKSVGNPLYDATRTASINNGGALPASIMTAFNNSLDIVSFTNFQNNLSGGPHGSVHSTIAGNMAIVTTAAKDPVFWLHHSNIDRLWELWLSKCGGRANPTTDATWLNKAYTFFDEFGTAVSLQGSQIVEIATQLNYKYDSLPTIPACTAAKSTLLSTESVLSKSTAVDLKGQAQKTTFTNESFSKLDAYVKKVKRTAFKFTDASQPERLIIQFDGITIGQMPEGVVEVYLNLPAGTTNPSYRSKQFVGLLDLFSAEHLEEHAGMATGEKITLDATKTAAALKLSLTDLKSAELFFFVRGNNLDGKEVKTAAQINIKNIQFLIQSFQN